MSKPHILIVGAFPPSHSTVVGGIVTCCRLLLETNFPERFDITPIDTTQISNPPPGLMVRAWLAFWRFQRYLWHLRRQRPSAVLLFAASGLSIVEKGIMAWCARLVGVPALIFPRGDVEHRQGLTRLVHHWALRGADKVLCQGPTWQRFAVSEVGFALPDAPVLPNWTARPVLLAAGRTRRYEVSEVVRLVFIGWLERTKGVLELLTACARLKDLCAFELTLVGRGQLEPEARDFVSSHGLQDRVHFAGWLKDDEVDSILETSDALVLPSWAEGMPNAVIEAMAAGLPVVVTAVGNIPDFVTNNAEALLIHPRDVEALTEALQRVLTDPALRERMGRAGHSLAATVFSPESASDELAHEVEDSMAKARRLREAHGAMSRFFVRPGADR